MWMRAFVMILSVVLMGAASGLLLRAVFPGAWQRWLRRAFLAGVAGAVAAVVVWLLGRSGGAPGVAVAGATATAVLLVSLTAVFLSSPAWGAGGALVRRLPDPSRRAFLGRAVGVVPSAAALAGPTGAVAASATPLLRDVEVASAHVPPALDGLTILQLSDVHLGAFIDVQQVQAVVDAARPRRPDVIVLTGDIADDYELLPPAMAALRTLAPPLGIFASIGNHEVYRGRARGIALFEEGGARFLCDEGVLLEHKGERLWIGGADDPARLGGEHRPFLEKTVARCLERCPADVQCRIVLSHRPEGFDAAARLGATLTLAGHTHGAQMALFGRSLLEGIIPMDYLLGLYRRGESALYTTAGLGHWFPFRLNCPAEAALVTLRAKADPAARDG
jgi:uncharacterized protein